MCVPRELVSLCLRCAVMENRAIHVLFISTSLPLGTETVQNGCTIQACWMDTWTEAEVHGIVSLCHYGLLRYYYTHGAEEQIWGSPRSDPAYLHQLHGRLQFNWPEPVKQQAGQSHQEGPSSLTAHNLLQIPL